MLRFVLGLLYFLRFHFVLFICQELCWMRGLYISFTSEGGSKKFEDWKWGGGGGGKKIFIEIWYQFAKVDKICMFLSFE